MCTMTAILLPTGDGVRVAFNRDELRARPAALPLRTVQTGERTSILPIDRPSGGTWIGVNDAGLFAATLNVNLPHRYGQARPQSRGTLVPRALRHESIDDAIADLARLPLEQLLPFRLILLHDRRWAEAAWDDDALRITRPRELDEPLFATSSGLGDHRVTVPRRALFDATVRGRPNDPRTQAAFHEHRWPDRPEVSVCMRRDDAATISLTLVTLRRDAAAMRYRAGAPDEPAHECARELPFAGRMARCPA